MKRKALFAGLHPVSQFVLHPCSNHLNDEFFMSDFTDWTNGTACKALLTALLHIAQVRPVACNSAFENCAVEGTATKAIAKNNNTVFITSIFKMD